MSATDPAVREPFRVLLYAHVDLNVIDGSAFFVAGAASLLTSAPGIRVDVVSATPITRAVVVQEMLLNPRVTVTDPFADAGLAARRPELTGLTRIDEATAAVVLDHYLDRGHYDVVLVRSTEVADALARRRPDLRSRLCVYVTGVVAADVPIDVVTQERLQRLLTGGATLLCQTPEMRDHLGAQLDAPDAAGSLAVMSPAVPSEQSPTLPGTDGPLLLAYTGKFAPAWNTVEMLAGFKQAASASPGLLRLAVAGDHFKRPPQWPTFVQETRYLLGSHPDLTWVGAVTRAEARTMVASADVGLSWRSAELDHSLELSTKLLEHGVLGRPCVINPTAMHRRLFGDDYPLFARSMTDYVDLLGTMARDRSLVRDAAQTAMDVARDYTYDRVFREVFPTLLAAAAGAVPDGVPAAFAPGVAALLTSGRRLVEHDGWVVAWLTDSGDAARVLAHLGDAGLRDVETFGPVVRWRAAATETTPGARGVPALQLVVDLLLGSAGRAPTDDPAGTAHPGAPAAVGHDRAGRVVLTGAPPAEPPADASPAASAPEAITPAADDDRAAAMLAADVIRRAAEADTLRRRYHALSGSRLGRTQLAYWRLRSRLRRAVRRSP